MATSEYQQDKASVLSFGLDAAKFYLNPINKYLYNPGAWSVTRGAIHYNAKGPLYKVANWSVGRFGKLFGQQDLVNKAKDNIKRAAGGFGKMFGVESMPAQGYFGVDRYGSSRLFKVGSSKFFDGDVKALPNSVNDLINKYIDTGKQMSKKEFIKEMKVRHTGTTAEFSSFWRSQWDQYSPSNYDINVQKNIVKGKLKGIKPDIRAVEQKIVTVNSYQYNRPKINKILNKKNVANLAELNSETRLLKDQLWKIRMKGTGLFAAKTAIRGAVAFGKLGAYAATAGLIYQAASMIANPIGQAMVKAVDTAFSQFSSFNRPELGGQISMSYLSSGAATERQRAIDAISRSRINGRSQFGNEAQFMHQ